MQSSGLFLQWQKKKVNFIKLLYSVRAIVDWSLFQLSLEEKGLTPWSKPFTQPIHPPMLQQLNPVQGCGGPIMESQWGKGKECNGQVTSLSKIHTRQTTTTTYNNSWGEVGTSYLNIYFFGLLVDVEVLTGMLCIHLENVLGESFDLNPEFSCYETTALITGQKCSLGLPEMRTQVCILNCSST